MGGWDLYGYQVLTGYLQRTPGWLGPWGAEMCPRVSCGATPWLQMVLHQPGKQLPQWESWVSGLVGSRLVVCGDQGDIRGHGLALLPSSRARLPCYILALSSFGLASLCVSQCNETGSLPGAPKLGSRFPERQHGPETLKLWKATL